MSMIRTRLYCCHVVLFLLSPFLSSGLRVTTLKEVDRKPSPRLTSQVSTTKRDITTPITTVPTPNPTSPNPEPASPLTASSTLAPSSPATATPSGLSWCVASQGASRVALQLALDYACGYGAADCSAIQPGGGCYDPNTVRDHASYAFNSYYHKNPVPDNCNFAGTAVATSTNPSTGTCQYPSTSTSSSILNTTNSSGSTVFGAVPSGPTPPPSTAPKSSVGLEHFFTVTCLVVFLAK